MKPRVALLVAFVALAGACGGDTSGARPDAAPRADAAPTCPPQAAPLAPGMHALYLAFEGETLTLGDCDDARTNCSSLVAQASTEVPPLFDGIASRTTRIATS